MTPLKDLGAEFRDAASKLEEARASITKARLERLAFVRDVLRREEEELESAKRRALELPIAIAARRAEIARLEASTADDLLREAVGGARPKTDDLPHQMLDLRTLPAGTVCEAVDVLACDGKPAGIEAGERFTIRWVEGHLLAATDVGGRYIDPVQPARVVERIKHACPRCDEGMREVEITDTLEPINGLISVPGYTKGHRLIAHHFVTGSDGEPAVMPHDNGWRILSSAFRFVRNDIPPRSEWCDGSGVRS